MKSKEINEYLSIGLVLSLMAISLSAVTLLCNQMIDETKTLRDKDYEEWKEWSGHEDMPYSVYRDLKSNSNLPPKK